MTTWAWAVTGLEIVLYAATAIVCVPLATLLVECVAAALCPKVKSPGPLPGRGRLDVLIPAHDEAGMIATTIASIRPQLRAEERIWVVADNCHDATATIARASGAQVFERTDDTRRGKGYALEFGLRQIAADPPDTLVVVDADCQVQPGSIALLAGVVAATGEPAQAAYSMRTAVGQTSRGAVSEWAVTLKNIIRPLGLRRLGMPCLLTGSGMAFPWRTLEQVSLGSGHVVEDMQLAIDLLLKGHRPQFCPDAQVIAALPLHAAAATGQRRRWEHGHLLVLTTQAPRLLWAACRQMRIDLLIMALELAVPPLSLLCLVGVGVTALAVLAAVMLGVWIPLLLLVGLGMASLAAMLLAGQRCLLAPPGLRLLRSVPRYAFGKLPLYLSFVFARERSWTRTPRDPSVENV